MIPDDFDGWVQRFFDEADIPWRPSADVHETGDELVVTVDVPGHDREDVDLREDKGKDHRFDRLGARRIAVQT